MRIIRVRYQGRSFYASIDAASKQVTCLQSNMGFTDPIDMSDITLMPLVAPSKIIAVGLNFSDHALELGLKSGPEPAFFLKPPSSLLANGLPIQLPRSIGQVDYEAELAIVIGQFCRNISPEQARDFIFGYTCANDVTARSLQKGETMLGRSKGYDTFCPLGPWIETEPPEMTSAIRTIVNGEVRQEGHIGEMQAKPLELVSYISGIMSLVPGDVILTGTPAGVGEIKPGDTVQVEIENVGLLSNSVEWDTQSVVSAEFSGHLLQ